MWSGQLETVRTAGLQNWYFSGYFSSFQDRVSSNLYLSVIRKLQSVHVIDSFNMIIVAAEASEHIKITGLLVQSIN